MAKTEKIYLSKSDGMINPYPKDVFKWDNKERLNFNRGRFNQYIHEMWELTRKETAEAIFKELEKEVYNFSILTSTKLYEIKKKFLGKDNDA